MERSTYILALVCVLLCLAIGLLWWRIAPETLLGRAQRELSTDEVAVGLPIVEGDTTTELESDKSLLWWDGEGEVILHERNGYEQRPLASITKLMTAMVALDYGIDWDKSVTIAPEDQRIGSSLLLHPGEHVTMRDLFHASLLGSANNATLAYVRALGISEEEFVQTMNRKTIEMGLEQTTFYDVTGLSTENVSTAYEVARLAERSWNDYPEIADASKKTEYAYVVGGTGREHTIRNTNKLVSKEDYVLGGSKTGYLHEAGFCLVVQGEDGREDDIFVVLGASSEWDSLEDMKALLTREE